MASIEDRVKKLEALMAKAASVTSSLQGLPSDATLAIAHNDSWLFEDNVDATHPANLRYVIASTTQRVVSARLSIHLAPFRTYNSLTVSATGIQSVDHNHSSAPHSHGHGHSVHVVNTGIAANANVLGPASSAFGDSTASSPYDTGNVVNSNATVTTPTATGIQSVNHTHNVSASGVLGVTEGATATGVTVAFDGVDATANLGGPFTTDQIELNVAPYLMTTKGAWHVIAMQPSGLGRIEAHLRLGVYVTAGSNA